MAIFQLILGLPLVGLGLFAIVRRESLTAREGRRPDIGPTGWTVFGVAMILAGVVQLVNVAV